MKKIFLVMSLLLSGMSLQARDRFPDHGDSRYGGIDAYRRNCYSDICHYDLSWRVNYGNTVVTLEVQGGPESGVQKLFACSGQSGHQSANWIRRDGARYIFKLYNSDRCTKDVGYYENAVDRVVIREGFGNDGGGHDDGGYGYADISSRRQQCYTDMCTHNIIWRVRGNSSVVTVVDQQTGREKLFACGSNSGQQSANWIPRNGTRVEFRLYDSDRCTQDVGKFQRPADRLVIVER